MALGGAMSGALKVGVKIVVTNDVPPGDRAFREGDLTLVSGSRPIRGSLQRGMKGQVDAITGNHIHATLRDSYGASMQVMIRKRIFETYFTVWM